MAKLLPPIGTKGRYTLKTPFSTKAGMLYECGAIRYFTDIENNGRNVFKLYYEPFGLPESEYHADRNNGEVIVTLLSASEAPIYVPSSYILSYPDLSAHPYHQVVLSASLGPLPVTVNLDHLITQMRAVISDTIGITPTVNVGIMPLLTEVTPVEHETAEAARESAIRNRTTDYARLADEINKNAVLTQRLRIAEELLIEHGIV